MSDRPHGRYPRARLREFLAELGLLSGTTDSMSGFLPIIERRLTVFICRWHACVCAIVFVVSEGRSE